MRVRRGRVVDEVGVDDVCCGEVAVGRFRYIKLALVGLVFACVMVFAETALAATEPCPNEALRVGPSASLPDCRAYELVTPGDLGRSQDMTFTGEDHATPSGDGEQIALETNATIEPNMRTGASVNGAHAVFSRTPGGWTMRSVVEPESSTGADNIETLLFSPDLSQVALSTYTFLNAIERSSDKAFEVGPVGGPYTLIANIPLKEATNSVEAHFIGANAGSASIPAFSDVLLESSDDALPLSAAERAVAEGTVAGAKDVYDWTGGQLRLVDVTSKGALTSPCGAELGNGIPSVGPGAVNAVSEDGSKIFFTSPERGASCPESPRLYMRVDGRETVEVSAPQGVTVEPSERKAVEYLGAAPDGSEVFFTTETRLTKETPEEEAEEDGTAGKMKLFMYDTVTGVLTRVATGFAEDTESNRKVFVISEDGSTVYYEIDVGGPGASNIHNVYRYETEKATGAANPSLVAQAAEPHNDAEPSYTTWNGDFLVFAGSEHYDTELYRYDHADGSVMCVSCGEGSVAPAEGEVFESDDFGIPLESYNEIPGVVQMSEDGQEVFFETTARLVSQDTNSTTDEGDSVSGHQGMDVYEWEADGTEEGEGTGMFCRVVNGCTHLLSAGEDVGPEMFLGASKNGKNVFLASAAQLLPQATPEFTNIYDARVDGGFPQPPPPPECTSCQGVGNPPPLFNVPASVAFTGAGNPAPPVTTPAVTVAPKKTTKCPKSKKLSHGRCTKTKINNGKRAKSHKRGKRS